MRTEPRPECVLTFVRDGVLTEQPLTNARMLIGRAEGCDVCFPFHPEISRLHASLSAAHDGWLIDDVTSRSGTYVNGERVLGSRLLHDNDVVRIGKVELIFRRKRHAEETVLGSHVVAGDAAPPASPVAVIPSVSIPNEVSGDVPVPTADTNPPQPAETNGPGSNPGRLNYYEVIGVANFESDVSRIHDAAKAQLRSLREGGLAEHAGDRTADFETVSEAMLCLTNRRRKRDYDQQLADRLGVEIRVSGDRVIPLHRAGGAEAALIAVALVVLGVIAWFATPALIEGVQKFFDQLQRSLPASLM